MSRLPPRGSRFTLHKVLTHIIEALLPHFLLLNGIGRVWFVVRGSWFMVHEPAGGGGGVCSGCVDALRFPYTYHTFKCKKK